MAVLATTIAMTLFATPAYAPSNTYNMAVACDGVTIKSGATQAHNGGTVKIKQNSTNPVSSTWVSARSSFGNDLTFKKVSDGTEATWTSVIANSGYTVRAYRHGYLDCNGFWPGSGNYTLNYTFTTA
jgi:hypothetical protein